MRKDEIAQYLVNLESLMATIQATGSRQRPRWMIDEYNRNWELLKQGVEDEARSKQ